MMLRMFDFIALFSTEMRPMSSCELANLKVMNTLKPLSCPRKMLKSLEAGSSEIQKSSSEYHWFVSVRETQMPGSSGVPILIALYNGFDRFICLLQRIEGI